MSKFRAKWQDKDGLPNNEYRLLVYVFENEFPNFVRRAQKVSKEMVEKVRAKMNTFTGKEYSFNAIDMQLKYAFSEYLSSSENMLDGYREHDLRLIEIYN